MRLRGAEMLAEREDEVIEIDLEHAYIAQGHWISPRPGERVVQLTDVLAQLDAARVRGAGVLLSVDSLGGPAWVGLALYAALRSFSESGGRSVVYVADHAGSSAAEWILGADYVVAHPGAVIWPHGVVVLGDRPRSTSGADTWTLFAAMLLMLRTGATEDDVMRWVGCEATLKDPGGEPLRAPEALALGFLDDVGTRTAAKAIVTKLARGEGVQSARAALVHQRAERWPEDVAIVRGIGAEILRRARAGMLDLRLENILVERFGAERAKLFRPWLQAVANQRDAVPDHLRQVNWMWSGLRSAAATAALGWSIPRAIGDLADPLISLAAGDIRADYLARATWKCMTDYRATRDFVRENSGEVRDRVDNQVHKLQKAMGEMGGRRGLQHPTLRALRDSAFITMEMVDRLVTTPIWLARYLQTRDRLVKAGPSEDVARRSSDPTQQGEWDDLMAHVHEKAVRDGNDAVRAVLPPHDIADLPALIRDRRGLGSMLLFYGHANKIWNLYRRQVGDIGRAFRSDEASVGDKAGAVARFAGTVLAVSAVNGLLSEWLSGRGQEQDESFSDWTWRKMIAALLYPFPFVGAFGDWAAGKLITGKTRRLSIKNAPQLSYGLQLAERIGSEVEKWQEGGDTGELAGLAARQAVELALAGAVGAPTRQVKSTLGYARDVANQTRVPRGPFDAAGGLLYGEDETQASNPLRSLQDLLSGK